jgi:two-component system LytT family response regulator
MIRTVIVDDEPLSRQRLRKLLEQEPDVELVAEFNNGRAAIKELPRVQPDLLFIDVEMPRVSGFELVEFARGRLPQPPAAVFVTAFEEYALRAFDEGALDYLLKPFDAARFSRTMQRVRERRATPRDVETDEDRRAPVAVMDRTPSRLAVKTPAGVRLVRFEEIDWIDSQANYLRLHVGRDVLLFRDTVQKFEEAYGRDVFVRINRSTLVNVDRIALLQPTFNRDYAVTLRDGSRLTLHHAYRPRLQPYVSGLFQDRR